MLSRHLDAASVAVPERRALLGFHRNAFADLTTAGGWTIFDNTIAWLSGNGGTPPPPPPAGGGVAHVVVGDGTSPATGDQSVIDRLENDLGYTVTVVDDGAPEDVAGADVVVITQSVGTSQVTGKYVDEAVPVLSMSTPTWDEHSLVSNQSAGYPYTTSDTLAIEQASHPTVTGATSPTATTGVTIGYAFDTDVPVDAEIIAAAKASATDRASLVVFETGDLDAASVAVPEKRALLGFHRNAFADLTTDGGWTIFDNTIAWLDPAPAGGGGGGGSSTPTYDAAGRLTSLDDTTITYDSRGLPTQLVTTTASGTTTQDRTYNGDGQLVDVTITEPGGGTETHHFTWDTISAVSQILAHNINGQANNYLYGKQREAVNRPNGTTDLFAYDHLGSTVSTTATSDVVVAAGYETFGTPDAGTDPAAIGFGYRGELHTGPTVYLRNRDYLPDHAVFTTIDPLGAVPGSPTFANPYHYGFNNPTNQVDPFGLRPTDDDFIPDQLAFTIPTPDPLGLRSLWEATKDGADAAWNKEWQYDWGSAGAGAVNTGWGGFKVVVGVRTAIAATGAGATIPIFGQVAAVFGWTYAVYQVTTGSARAHRGINQVDDFIDNPRCGDDNPDEGCTTKDNLARLVRDVSPKKAESIWDWLGVLP